MHESHELVSAAALLQVSLEVVIFICVFQVFCNIKNVITGLIFTGLLLWLSGGYHFASVVVYALLAAVAGYGTAKVLRTSKELGSGGFEITYYLIQPFLLIAAVPLFVAQTRVAVGYPLGFVVWLALNMPIFYLEGLRFFEDLDFFIATLVPIISVLTLGFFFDDNPWVAVGATMVIQAVVLLVLFKKNQQDHDSTVIT